ncbi:hypothetical protein AAG570_001765 [Ranatra chinensis]|uniref:Uncharacterized protein n=1 Tax=Ranatra chinensis TaxID=642074 RepID=A0ABD0Y9I5_9HEMI
MREGGGGGSVQLRHSASFSCLPEQRSSGQLQQGPQQGRRHQGQQQGRLAEWRRGPGHGGSAGGGGTRVYGAVPEEDEEEEGGRKDGLREALIRKSSSLLSPWWGGGARRWRSLGALLRPQQPQQAQQPRQAPQPRQAQQPPGPAQSFYLLDDFLRPAHSSSDSLELCSPLPPPVPPPPPPLRLLRYPCQCRQCRRDRDLAIINDTVTSTLFRFRWWDFFSIGAWNKSDRIAPKPP